MAVPTVSVVIPVYNVEKTLARCLDSVLAQSFRDFELIVIDDGSRDGSGILCDRYAQADSRVRVIHQENAGVSAARNAGIRMAQGRYITFADSDDHMLPTHLEQLYHAAAEHNCDIVVAGFTRIEQGQTSVCLPRQTGCFGAEIWEEICRDPGIYGYLWNKLFRRALLCTHDLFLCESMYSQEDLDFCLSAFGAADSVAQTACTTYQYDFVPGKRVPPYWDYLSNKLKLLRIGSSRTALSTEARACVHEQILSLLYTGLYDASARADYDEIAAKIARVEGLTQLLREIPSSGEHGFVARSFAAGKYGRIRRYFRIRNRLRDAVRIIRGHRP